MKIYVATPTKADIGHRDGYLVIEQEGVEVRLNYPQAIQLAGHIEALRYEEDAWEADE